MRPSSPSPRAAPPTSTVRAACARRGRKHPGLHLCSLLVTAPLQLQLAGCAANLVDSQARHSTAGSLSQRRQGLCTLITPLPLRLAIITVGAQCAGVSISTGRASEVRVDPELPEAAQLRQWYDSVGRSVVTAPAGEGLTNGRSAPRQRHPIPLATRELLTQRYGWFQSDRTAIAACCLGINYILETLHSELVPPTHALLLHIAGERAAVGMTGAAAAGQRSGRCCRRWRSGTRR